LPDTPRIISGEASIEDQLEVCRRYIERQGWTIVRTYEDRALSGSSDQRSAYQQMLVDAEAGRFDVMVTEALDRLGRRLSDVARLYNQLEFRGIKLHAVNIGQVTTMHVGLLGTMAQLYLSDLKEKTRRGQLGRALAGKIPGWKGSHSKIGLNPGLATALICSFRNCSRQSSRHSH
jgi:site-specific DNA recombinase